ncbi:hypothetical protein ASD60_05340 [Pseudomonas sp. Root562]|nr:hypothetical protein ASD60_05340 [Pseudomonas sp. Root562]
MVIRKQAQLPNAGIGYEVSQRCFALPNQAGLAPHERAHHRNIIIMLWYNMIVAIVIREEFFMFGKPRGLTGLSMRSN